MNSPFFTIPKFLLPSLKNSTTTTTSRITTTTTSKSLLPPVLYTSSSSQTHQHHHQQTRHIHQSLSLPQPPSPTSQCPDVTTFLTLIGRNTVQFAPKFENVEGKTPWEVLFTANLRDLEIEPARDRRYILAWRQRFRNGELLREYKRGVKVDGGERRYKMVQAKRRAEENRAARKAEAGAKLMGGS